MSMASRDASTVVGAAPNADVLKLMQKIEALAVVPERFEAAVREFAGWVDLDADGILRGETFEMGGVDFTLMHYGPLDPGGATIVVDYGEFTFEDNAAMWRQLLEHNLHTPAGVHGYFGLAPGHDKILFCVRVDLAHAENPAQAIGTVIGMAVQSIRSMRETLVKQVDAMQGKGPAGAGAMA